MAPLVDPVAVLTLSPARGSDVSNMAVSPLSGVLTAQARSLFTLTLRSLNKNLRGVTRVSVAAHRNRLRSVAQFTYSSNKWSRIANINLAIRTKAIRTKHPSKEVPMSEENAAGSASDIQAVTRAAQILQLFGPNRPQLTAAEAADLLNLNRSTVYRYCNSLVAAGLLERGHAIGSFIPGGLLLQLGAFAMSQRKVLDLAPAVMRDLSFGAHMTAVLSLWGSGGP